MDNRTCNQAQELVKRFTRPRRHGERLFGLAVLLSHRDSFIVEIVGA